MKPAIARIRSRPCLSCRYSKYGIFSDGRLLTPPAWPTRENVSSPLVVGRSLITICSSTMYASRPTAPTSATIPARERCRASQASCLSLSCVTATPNTLRPRRRRETHPARRLGPDLVAPDQARGAVAGVEHHVQGGRGDADQGLDPSHARELLRTAVGHAGAIVDSPFVLVREVMTESVVTASPQASVREIAVLMRERNVGSVVLVDDGRPVGFITDRDLALSVVADGRSADDRASDHASSPVITGEPDMEVEEAGELMMRHGVRRIVVLSGGALAGVVTLDDLTTRGLAPELSARVTRAALPDYFFHPRGG